MNPLTVFAFIILFIITGIAELYSAKRQSEIYKKQGFEMSTTDVLLGIKPNEKVIFIKQ